MNAIQEIKMLENGLNTSLEDLNQLEHLIYLNQDGLLRSHHFAIYNDIAKRHNCNVIGLESFNISNESFFSMLQDIFVSVSKWISGIFTKTKETTNDVVSKGTVKSNDIKPVQEVNTHLQKLMSVSFKDFTKLEKLKGTEVLAGKHDEALLQSMSPEELKDAKKWVKKLTTVWNTWNGMLTRYSETTTHGEFNIGLALREIKLVANKGIMNADGVSEVFSKNFDLRKYFLIPSNVTAAKKSIEEAAKATNNIITDIENYVKNHDFTNYYDEVGQNNAIIAKHKPGVSFISLTNDFNAKAVIDDNFVNKILPGLVNTSSDFLNHDNIQLENSVLKAIKPLANEQAAKSYFNNFNSNLTSKINSSDDPSEKKQWERLETNLIRTICSNCKSVVRDYTIFLKEMLNIQRFAKFYIRFTNSLTSLNLE